MQSPYADRTIYDRALAAGRHREVTGGWWEETGRIQLDLLKGQGMTPGHRLLDVGAGALRLGCKAVPYLDARDYWATDASGALMRRGWEAELDVAAKARLPLSHLVEDAGFGFPGVPGDIDFVMIWGVFPHLPPGFMARALTAVARRFPRLAACLFTVFHPAPAIGGRPATHGDRAPWHVTEAEVQAAADSAGMDCERHAGRVPRGQVLYVARHPGRHISDI
jgi:hypothetical protein